MSAVVLAEGQVWRSRYAKNGVHRDVVITGWDERYTYGTVQRTGRRTRIMRGSGSGVHRGGPEGYRLVADAPPRPVVTIQTAAGRL